MLESIRGFNFFMSMANIFAISNDRADDSGKYYFKKYRGSLTFKCFFYFSTTIEQQGKLKRNYMKIPETAGAALR